MYPPPPTPPPPQWELYADSDQTMPPAPPPISPTASAPPLDQNLAGDVSRNHQFPRAAGRGAAAVPVPSHPPAPWSTGLFDCFDDVGNCCVTCLCPCITFGQVAEILDHGSTSCEASGALYAMIMFVTGCSWVYSCFYRSKLRRQFFLQEAPCADCLVHCCCESCALCQEYRELAGRGFDLRNGWKANNMERKRPALTAPPTMDVSMSR